MKERGHKFGIRANSRPGPGIAVAPNSLKLFGYVLTLGIDERPNLIALQSLASQILKGFVLVFCTGFAQIQEKFNNESVEKVFFAEKYFLIFCL